VTEGPQTEVQGRTIDDLAVQAWQARANARVLGATKVGCAVVDETGLLVATGCNVEHRFRSHDIHAETNALSSLVTAGGTGLGAVVIAAERSRFSPCGACLDWIFELGGSRCLVGWQSTPAGEIIVVTASDLMPYYPE
jgi:cytidine deaminase